MQSELVYPLVMDGVHDLGGVAGFGAIEVEADEQTFHEAWEATAFRINIASKGVRVTPSPTRARTTQPRTDPLDPRGAKP